MRNLERYKFQDGLISPPRLNMERWRSVALPVLLCAALVTFAAATTAPPVRLECNATLKAGSTLALTDKLDLSGRQPDQPNSITSACGIYGPVGSGEPATIIVPDNDCVLLAQGEVTISGNVRFIVGHKSRSFDCCDDGEGHGSILCSYSNLTITADASVTLETVDSTVVVNPGGFWTGEVTRSFIVTSCRHRAPALSFFLVCKWVASK